jgi:ABC-type nitrate/sulfonate/bicarbonate transport system permease component
VKSQTVDLRRAPAPLLPLAVSVVLLTVWEVMASSGLISPIVAPAPSRIFAALMNELRTGDLQDHLSATAARLAIGLFVGGTIGILSGMAMGLSSKLRRFADPFVAAAHPLPKIAILPIVMVFLGVGELSKVAVVALGVFFPMLINTMTGVRQISPSYFDVAKSYGATRWKLFTRVVIPAAMPMILSGLRIGLNIALVVTISIEIVAASRGLGALIWLSWEVLRIEVLYAALFVTATLGICFNVLMQFLLGRLVPWAPKIESA